MPLQARYGVAFLWLVDSLARTLAAYALQDEHWVVTGQKDQHQVTVEPFSALALANLWIEVED